MVDETNQRQGGGAQFDDEIGLRQLLVTLLNGRYTIVVFATVFAAIAIVYILLVPPIYRASSFVPIKDNAQGIPRPDGTVHLIASKTLVAQELQFIKSPMLVGRVVDELDLTTHISPIYLPLFGAALARRHSDAEINDPLLGLDSFAWGGEKFHVSYLKVPRDYLGQSLDLVVLDGLEFSLFHNGNELLKGSVGQMALGLNGEIQILVDTLTARPGTRFEVKKSSRLDAILKLQSTLSVTEEGMITDFIEIALKGEDRAYILEVVDSVTRHFYRQREKHLSLDGVSTLDFLEQQILVVKADLSYLEEAVNDFRSKGDSVDLSLKAGAPSDSLVQVEAGINAMSINKIENSRRFTAEHPSYISLKRQQENLQEQRIKLGAKLAEFPETLAERLRRTRDFEPQQAILVTSDKRRQELAILGILLFGMLSLIIVLLRFRTFTTNEVAKANDYDPQKLPTKIWDKIADGKNLLTPQELDALLRPSKITD